MKKITLTQGKFALVDDTDYEWINQWKWFYSADGYAVRAFQIGHGKNRKVKIMRMHRLILDAPPKLEVDHIDHNRLNNIRINLRVSTRAENARNASLGSRNTSGFKGVCWDKERLAWATYIKTGGRHIYLGRFKSKELAAEAYNQAAIKYFGEFASLNAI
ncbi:AP2 domain-containing protein [Candidatus Dojkabacteria bacterium]|jgi:hypothetical protein|nr:AP2 domain-containing protein [Candidatus Dojkabacteria bacterium]